MTIPELSLLVRCFHVRYVGFVSLQCECLGILPDSDYPSSLLVTIGSFVTIKTDLELLLQLCGNLQLDGWQ